MRTLRLLGASTALVALAAAGCAGAPSEQPVAPGGDPDGAGTPVSFDAGTEVAALTTLLQQGEEEPQLCLGGVMESYPPQCGGPVVVGLDWDDVADTETASGTTWGTGWVVGTYDDAAAVLTLTRPVAAEPPDGVEPPEQPQPELPALCDDPDRGGDEGFDASSAEGAEARERLASAAAALPGYVGLYVSDGADAFNVLVQGDAEEAHATLREDWPGWLCVATSDGATEADVLTAQEVLHGALGDRLLGSGGHLGRLDVTVVLADEGTWQDVLDAVEPWLEPEHVAVQGALTPIG